MNRSRQRAFKSAVALLLVLAACTGREKPSALYVLEELDAATSVAKPRSRVERLRIFIANHADHPYRSVAYQRVLKTMYEDLEDGPAASRYVGEALSRETDASVRGDLLYAEFEHLLEKDRGRALALADSLLPVERSPRLFL